jgi:hypothetical protein
MKRASCRSGLRPSAAVPRLASLSAFHRHGRDCWIWRRRRRSSWGAIEIEVSGARVRVGPGVELATLATVLSALRGER